MRVGIYSYPHTLSLLPKKQQDIVNQMFPVDTGFEIECLTRHDISNGQMNRDIHDLGAVHVNCDSMEKRFRIPAGVKGLIVLFDILKYLKETCHPNPSSGIHYHIDCTDLDWYSGAFYNPNNVKNIFANDHHAFDKFLLDPIKSWGYEGTFNQWRVSDYKTAVRLHDEYQTIEFRIGEHSFDYNLIVHRITHCHSLVKKLKTYLRSL